MTTTSNKISSLRKSATLLTLMITVLLVGTTANTAIIPAVLATTETVSIENGTDTEVTTQDDEAIADGETQQSTGGEVGQESPSSSTGNQSEPTTLPSANNTNATDTIDVGLDGRIVFSKSLTADQPDTAEIYVMNADGSDGQTRLTDNTVADFDPSWSPDGEKIAFASGSGDVDPEIYVMNADGSGVIQLTNNNGYDASPSWSPDGEKIAFTSDRDAGEDSDQNAIYVMNSAGADSSNATRLTEPDSYYEDLDWSGSESTPGGGSNATNNTGGGGGNATEPLAVQALIDIDQDATPVVVFEASIDGGRPPYTCDWDLGDGTTVDTCNVSHIYENPGTYGATINVTDSVGQTASDSTEEFSITNTGNDTGGNNTGGIEELPVDGLPSPPPTTTDDTGGP
jgi:TolB protein